MLLGLKLVWLLSLFNKLLYRLVSAQSYNSYLLILGGIKSDWGNSIIINWRSGSVGNSYFLIGSFDGSAINSTITLGIIIYSFNYDTVVYYTNPWLVAIGISVI